MSSHKGDIAIAAITELLETNGVSTFSTRHVEWTDLRETVACRGTASSSGGIDSNRGEEQRDSDLREILSGEMHGSVGDSEQEVGRTSRELKIQK